MLDRKVGEYELPEGASLIACGNRETDRGVVHRMPTPLSSRFVHLEIRVDAEDWLAWGAANAIAAEVLFFITYEPDLLHQFDPRSKERAFPCPRTWEFASNIVKHRNGLDPSAERALFRGTVGEAAAVEFAAFLKVWRELPQERHRRGQHLRHFVAVRHALLKTRALGASLVELLDNVRAGVVQLDRRGRLAAVNDRARALLRRGDGLRDEGGRLRAALPREDAALQGLIARALPLLDGPGEGGSMPLSRRHTPSRLVLHVSPVHDAGVESGRGRVGALVLAVDPGDRTGFDPQRVGKALGLTPAESRVAVSLAEGKTIDDIAAETARNRTTVKWHIRHIYAELGVSRPIELAQLVTSLADVPGVRG